MIAALRFVELVAAIVALIGRMRDINTELVKQLAQLRRARPRSETLERLERQLCSRSAPSRRRRSRHPGREARGRREEDEPTGTASRTRAAARALARVPVVNAVPPERRVCPMCGREMTTVGHSSCEILDVIPARIVVNERLDERVACPNDDTIVSAPPAAADRRARQARRHADRRGGLRQVPRAPAHRAAVHALRRAGVDIAPQTLGRSVAAAIDLLAPVAPLIEEQTRGPGLLGTDATGIPVLDPSAPGGHPQRHHVVLDQRAMGDLLLLAERRLRERETLPRRRTSRAPCSATARASRPSSSAPAASVPAAGLTRDVASSKPRARRFDRPRRRAHHRAACSPSSATRRSPATPPSSAALDGSEAQSSHPRRASRVDR